MKDLFEKHGITQSDILLWGGLAALVYVIAKGGFSGAAESITHSATKAVTDAVTGAVTGAVRGPLDSVSETTGLPTTQQTTTDPFVARWIIDHPQGGWAAASAWSGALAFAKAATLPAGTGHAPPPGSDLARRFPDYNVIDMPVSTGGTANTDNPYGDDYSGPNWNFF